MLSIKSKSELKDSKYTKILNNLLDIKGRDQSIFASVNGTTSFDVATKFGTSVNQKIVKQKEFAIKLQEQDLEVLRDEVYESTDPDEIIALYAKYKEKLFNTKMESLKSSITFLNTKNDLLEKLDIKIQKAKSRWAQYIRKAKDINIQENVWPLHVATFYVSLRTNKRQVFAPLLLREVEITQTGSSITMKSSSDWKLNDKLIFFLNDEGFELNQELDLSDKTGLEAIEIVAKEYNITEPAYHLAFNNVKKESIKSKLMKTHKGIVLGLFKPAGGHLRKTMLHIIENDEMDEILDPDPVKQVYKDKINGFIRNNSKEIVRIQNSNFAQDKALISSLLQDTIIWGPPGTGKSQVIANIIANVLNRKETAVVMSQKKAALDVLKERLGSISRFVLFVLNDNKLVKSEFYKPLQDFVNSVENSNFNEPDDVKTIITENQIDALKTISDAKNNGTYQSDLAVLNSLSEIKENKTNVIKSMSEIDKEMYYPDIVVPTVKDYLNMLAYKNNVQKKGWIFKRYPSKFKSNGLKAFNVLSSYNVDLNLSLKNLLKTSSEEVINIMDAPTFLKRNTEFKSNEIYLRNVLGNRILEKIIDWKENDKEKFNAYRRFANAARAARRLPFKFINDHITVIKELFPVIITTPETSFVDWEKESFDYAILDESSQMFLEIGLPILYLSKIKVLAGDSEQMQPSRWFTSRDDSEQDEDVAENAESLLDYAHDKGVFSVMLNQNYRASSASLMSFSSRKFYDSNLEVISKPNSEVKPIEVVNVKGKWEKGVNIIEANKVIQIAQKNIKKYHKIILLAFNSSQKELIEKEIIEHHPKLFEKVEENRLVLRNIENIQGDEADLIIASVVYDETTNMSSTYVSRPGGKNALNVAISRAREKMIVVKSVKSTNIKSGKSQDFIVFKEWLEFIDLTPKQQQSYSAESALAKENFSEINSGFEEDVYEYLMEHLRTRSGYKIIKQYEVGSKKIDLAFVDIETGQFKLGIEIDGYKYHGGMGFDKYLEDVSRQEFLESKGYKIFRITEIDWKLSKENVLKELRALLK